MSSSSARGHDNQYRYRTDDTGTVLTDTGTWLFCPLGHIWRGGAEHIADLSQTQGHLAVLHLKAE
jgi:hypothetical protein